MSVATILPTTKVVLRIVAPRFVGIGLTGADVWAPGVLGSGGFVTGVFIGFRFVVFTLIIAFVLLVVSTVGFYSWGLVIIAMFAKTFMFFVFTPFMFTMFTGELLC